LLKAHLAAQALALLAFVGSGEAPHPPDVRLGASDGLLGATDGVFLKVSGLGFLIDPFGRLKRLGSLAAEVHHALMFGDFGFSGPDPLKLPEESLHLGPLAEPALNVHFHHRFAVAAPVVDLRRAGHRFDEYLDAFPAAAAGHVSDLFSWPT
jgi:hypothetical protein